MQWIDKSYWICALVCAIFTATSNSFLHAQSTKEQGIQERLEAEKAYFYGQNQEDQFQALIHKSQLLEKDKNWSEALKNLNRWNDFSKNEDHNYLLWYKKAFLHYQLGEWVESENYLGRLQFLSKSDQWKENTLPLFILCLAQQQKWSEAEKQMTIWAKNHELNDVEVKKLFESFKTIKFKSAEKAENLSLIPGLGQIYAGYPLRGFFSLGLQTVALGIGAWHIWQGYYVIGAYSGMGIFYLFYTGGMRHAGYLAEQKNLRKMKMVEDRLVNVLTVSE